MQQPFASNFYLQRKCLHLSDYTLNNLYECKDIIHQNVEKQNEHQYFLPCCCSLNPIVSVKLMHFNTWPPLGSDAIWKGCETFQKWSLLEKTLNLVVDLKFNHLDPLPAFCLYPYCRWLQCDHLKSQLPCLHYDGLFPS